MSDSHVSDGAADDAASEGLDATVNESNENDAAETPDSDDAYGMRAPQPLRYAADDAAADEADGASDGQAAESIGAAAGFAPEAPAPDAPAADEDGEAARTVSGTPRRVTTAAFAAPRAASSAASPAAIAVAVDAEARKRRIWPWVTLVIVILLLAASGTTAYAVTSHYDTRVLPGVSLWGRSMSGLTKEQVAEQIDQAVAADVVSVTYDGDTVQVGLADLGYSVDADQIAQSVMDAKRDTSLTQRYDSGATIDVSPAPLDAAQADPAAVGAKLGVESTAAKDASVALNEEGTAYEVTPSEEGTGVSVTAAAQALIDGLAHFGQATEEPVALEVTDVAPSFTTERATAAADTLNELLSRTITISGDGGDAAALGAEAVKAAVSVSPDDGLDGLGDGVTRSGDLVFDAGKLQEYYESAIKPNYSATEEDRDVIVNNNDEDIHVNVEGHPGVTVHDDSNVGADAVKALIGGANTIAIDADVTPMNVNKTKRHVVVDLSDRKLYAYENDEVIRTFNVGVGSGIRADGTCGGDFCTPTGDFNIWWKLPEQTMQGSAHLSNGQVTTWYSPGVRYINYFARSGCAIHRVATKSAMNDADLAGAHLTSHGCVGIGWDVAEWFYGWCYYNETVHIQE